MPKQILLADDSVTIGKMVEITFANEDFIVTVVRSGDEALARARANPPDVVLADAGMPGKSGYDLCAELRASGIQAPVLILTGNFSPYDEGRGRAAGADGNVVKPFETQAMIDRVQQLVGRGSVATPYRGDAPKSIEPAHSSPHAAPLPARSPTDPSRPAVNRPSQPMPSVPSSTGAPRIPPTAAPRPAAASVSAPRSTLMGLPTFSAGAIPGAPAVPAPGAPSRPVPHPTFVGASAATFSPPVKPEGSPSENDAKTMMEMDAPVVAASPSPASAKVPLPAPPRSVSAPMASVPPKASGPIATAAILVGGAVVQPAAISASSPIDVRATLVSPPPSHSEPPHSAPQKIAPPKIVKSPVVEPPTLHVAPPSPVAAPVASLPTPSPRAVAPPIAVSHPVVATVGNGDITARMTSDRSASATIPHDAPKMPRPSLIPNAPTPRSKNPAISDAVHAVARAAAPRVVEALGGLGGLGDKSTHGAEYDLIVKLSREVIEQIAWEVVPDLAETIIRAELDRLVKERARP